MENWGIVKELECFEISIRKVILPFTKSPFPGVVDRQAPSERCGHP